MRLLAAGLAAGRCAVALGAGLLFGFGLALARMTDPRKVLGFLDFAGPWDASLALVLAGATGIGYVTFRLILRRPAPVLDEHFHVTGERRWQDPRLLLGSALFGIGWGIGGYCPGPALAQLAAPNAETWIFLPALVAGSALSRLFGRPAPDRSPR